MDQNLDSLEICMAQRENMEAIFHAVTDGIVTLDSELRVLNVNRAAEAMLHRPARLVAGHPAGEVFDPALWDLEPILREVVTSGRSVRERENILHRADGREVRVIMTMSRLLDRSGGTAGAVVVIRDITQVRDLQRLLENRTSLHSILGKSHAMQEIFGLIEQIAPTDSTVVIEGESGTGKELIADAIHRCSRRAEGPFVKVNCSALSESLLESELFGHVKGAYTGALHDRKGRFELASGGTIFLDEVGDLSERIQVKLLRVLQEREIERVGDSRVMKIDVRVVAATHTPLRELVAAGRFRSDLYYRLNVIPISVPPLRDRLQDIPLLASAFLREMAGRLEKPISEISPDAMRALMDHRWPGNVRELRNAIEHAAVKCTSGTLLLEDLPREVIEATSRPSTARGRSPVPTGIGPLAPSPPAVDPAPGAAPAGRPETADETERREIVAALAKTGWNREASARLLGINRSTLWRRMKRLRIAPGTS